VIAAGIVFPKAVYLNISVYRRVVILFKTLLICDFNLNLLPFSTGAIILVWCLFLVYVSLLVKIHLAVPLDLF
jgi:hypothetical protein